LNKGEGYGKDEVMKEEVIASSNDLLRSIGSYRIHGLGSISQYILHMIGPLFRQISEIWNGEERCAPLGGRGMENPTPSAYITTINSFF
jgi:hypothetical protein